MGTYFNQSTLRASLKFYWASQMALVVKNLPANARDRRDTGSIPGSGRFPGEGNDNPLQYSCLESPRDRGVWWAAVQGVTKSHTTEHTQHRYLGEYCFAENYFLVLYIGKNVHIHPSTNLWYILNTINYRESFHMHQPSFVSTQNFTVKHTYPFCKFCSADSQN